MLAGLVILNRNVIGGELIEILDVGIELNSGRRILGSRDELLDQRNVTIVNVGVGNDVQELAGNHIDGLRNHH